MRTSKWLWRLLSGRRYFSTVGGRRFELSKVLVIEIGLFIYTLYTHISNHTNTTCFELTYNSCKYFYTQVCIAYIRDTSTYMYIYIYSHLSLSIQNLDMHIPYTPRLSYWFLDDNKPHMLCGSLLQVPRAVLHHKLQRSGRDGVWWDGLGKFQWDDGHKSHERKWTKGEI